MFCRWQQTSTFSRGNMSGGVRTLLLTNGACHLGSAVGPPGIQSFCPGWYVVQGERRGLWEVSAVPRSQRGWQNDVRSLCFSPQRVAYKPKCHATLLERRTINGGILIRSLCANSNNDTLAQSTYYDVELTCAPLLINKQLLLTQLEK